MTTQAVVTWTVGRSRKLLPGRDCDDTGAVDDCWLGFDEVIARWQLGDLAAEELPAAAVGALAAGCASPSLARLAGMEGSTWSEVEPVARRVLAERGCRIPDEKEAVRAVANGIARRIVAGSTVPEDAARQLNLLAWRVNGRPAHDDLWPFAGLWASLDVVAAGHGTIEQLRAEIVAEAQALLDRGGVR
jgi:hypothetical protein